MLFVKFNLFGWNTELMWYDENPFFLSLYMTAKHMPQFAGFEINALPWWRKWGSAWWSSFKVLNPQWSLFFNNKLHVHNITVEEILIFKSLYNLRIPKRWTVQKRNPSFIINEFIIGTRNGEEGNLIWKIFGNHSS